MELVNLQGNVVPTTNDIDNWMMAKILAGCGGMPNWMFTMQKLAGIAMGAVLGDPDLAYVPTETEQSELRAFAAVARDAQLAGREERRKRDLLIAVLAVEAEGRMATLAAGDSQDVVDLWTTRETARVAASTDEADDAA